MDRLTIVVSAMEPKLFMNMLHVTLTGGPGKEKNIMKTDRCSPEIFLSDSVVFNTYKKNRGIFVCS